MRARRSREEDIDFDEALLLDAPGRLRNFDTPEELAMSDEMAGIIKTGFDSLPGELGEALALREMEGYSYDEIAAIMHCPVGTVRSRIFRARETMDKALLEYLYH
ncbi:hypothetical protein MishRS11D_44470 (plasmid) [Methylomagnum ishizawai]|nr:hypothetical protein MishRS11D_44470 [Methylomagnum ishizawai]